MIVSNTTPVISENRKIRGVVLGFNDHENLVSINIDLDRASKVINFASLKNALPINRLQMQRKRQL